MSRYYVTTPIYYVNDAPHIGHAYTTVAADALARWHRLLGDETFFLTGTDEHGLKIQRAAEAHGLTPLEQADRTSERFRATWAQLNISHDDFIRTTEPRHYVAVQALLQRCYDNGYVYKSTYSGLYCVACEAYYTDSDLVDGKCPVHGTPVEHLEEENYFFRLSAFTERLLEWYENEPDCILPDGKRREAIGIVKQGLEDVSITRTSLQWGVPVPWDDRHVFYVWYDALINYATAVGYAVDDERFAKWWPATTHLLAKDILRFHGVYWPAMLMAAGIEPLPKLRVHGYLLVGGEKMSKTRLNQIAPGELIETFGVDGVRYHFLRDTPFGPDGDFSFEGMIARYNADLANQLGNLLQRVSTVVKTKCGGVGPAARADSVLGPIVAEVYADVVEAWSDTQPSVALEATWRIIRATNDYLQSNEPWKMEPGPACDAVMGDALEALRIVAILASPAMPAACEAIWQRIGLSGSVLDQRLPGAARWGGYPGGLPVAAADPLFPRLKG